MANGRVAELETALDREKQDRAEADERATRANERARQADEAYRKLQLELVAAKDEASAAREESKHLQDKLTAFEADLAKLRDAAVIKAASVLPPKPSTLPPVKSSDLLAPAVLPAEVSAHIESMLARIAGLREMLATAAIELSQLHADEVALGKKRGRVLSDACALLARALGATGQAPPPIPSALLASRLSIAPVVDISEVADLIESLRPPKAPKVE